MKERDWKADYSRRRESQVAHSRTQYQRRKMAIQEVFDKIRGNRVRCHLSEDSRACIGIRPWHTFGGYAGPRPSGWFMMRPQDILRDFAGKPTCCKVHPKPSLAKLQELVPIEVYVGG
jgi:hypothetical protein